jgi:acetyl esterase
MIHKNNYKTYRISILYTTFLFTISLLVLGNLMEISYSSSSSNDFSFLSNNLTPKVYAVNSTNPVNYTGLEQSTKSFLLDIKSKNNPPINSLPPNEARMALSGLQSSYPVDTYLKLKYEIKQFL